MCKKKLFFVSFLSLLLASFVLAQDGSVTDSSQSHNPYLDPVQMYQISSDEIKSLQDYLTNIEQENANLTNSLQTLQRNYNLLLLTGNELQINLLQLEQKHAYLLSQSKNLENRIRSLLLDLQTSNNQLTIVNNSLTGLLAERDELTTAQNELWKSYESYKNEVTKTIQRLQNETIIAVFVSGAVGLLVGFVVGALAF